MSWKNPLIGTDTIDTLHSIDHHLRFIRDYFRLKCRDDDDDTRIPDGVSHAIGTAIAALDHVIDCESAKPHDTKPRS